MLTADWGEIVGGEIVLFRLQLVDVNEVKKTAYCAAKDLDGAYRLSSKYYSVGPWKLCGVWWESDEIIVQSPLPDREIICNCPRVTATGEILHLKGCTLAA